jgi:antitoxin VapB
MGLNIKNKETHQLAVEVAELTGETMTEAITVALKERLQRLRRERDVPAVLSRVQAALAGLRPETPENHATLLYDDRGLPR